MNLSNQKILITGGATGIGLGLTERFIQEGNTVLICGRREEALRKVADRLPNVIYRVCDVAQPAHREALYAWVKDEHPDLTALVNNAGIQNWMSISEPAFMDKAEDEITINIEAPVHLCQLFAQLPSLKTILNVTSGLAFAPLAKTPVYCATKAFLRSFTLSLRVMLKGRIEVIEIIPPALNTDLGGKGLHDAFPPVSAFIDSIFAQLHEGRTELTFGTSESRLNAGADELRAYFNQMNGL